MARDPVVYLLFYFTQDQNALKTNYHSASLTAKICLFLIPNGFMMFGSHTVDIFEGAWIALEK